MTKNELRKKFRHLATQNLEPADYCNEAVGYIHESNSKYDWVGVYIAKPETLEIPDNSYYVGPVTQHTVIPYDEGICGAAATQRETIVVDDVNKDPRFIACSITTQSEIVVPIEKSDTLYGVLDLDSDTPAAFTTEDQQFLEDASALIAEYFEKNFDRVK